jgi:hypothetical protein
MTGTNSSFLKGRNLPIKNQTENQIDVDIYIQKNSKKKSAVDRRRNKPL